MFKAYQIELNRLNLQPGLNLNVPYGMVITYLINANKNMSNDEIINPGPEMARIVERNIDALLARSKQEEKKKTIEEKIADHVTRFTGSMLFVYIHLVLFGIWIIWNVGWFGLKPFDPLFCGISDVRIC